MAEVVVRWVEDGTIATGRLDDLETARASGLAWADVLGIDEGQLLDLADRLNLHPLAIEDCLHFPQRPKIDEYAGSLFVVWVTPGTGNSKDIQMAELDVFLGLDFLVTVHQDPLPAISDTFAEGPAVFQRGTGGLFYELIDRLVDATMPLVDDLADRLEDIENVMMSEDLRTETQQTSVRDLYIVRRQLVKLHRVISPERDVLRALSRVHEIINEEAYRYLQDVGDHLARVEDSIETARDVAAAVMDIHLSVQSNRMNAIMKQLTVVATIFMPLTLISGIYGMNVVKGMWPPVRAVWSFAAVIAGMVAIAVGMALYFRRKNWW